jgi:hypothetical protein
MRTVVLALAAVLAGCARRAEPEGEAAVQHRTDDVVAALDSLRCARGAVRGECALYDVSLMELIAQPERFDGKPVRVIGYVHFEFDGNGLYLHREDYEHAISRNGVWLEPDESTIGAATPNDRYVIVEGTFRARDRGHLGMWSGALTQVTRLEAWEIVGKQLMIPMTPP